MENTKQSSSSIFRQWFSQHKSVVASYGGLVFCIILFSIITPLKGESIWSPAKLATLMSDVIVTAIMAVGAVFIYALGNLDISIGKQIGLYATIMVVLGNMTGSLLPGIVVCIVLSIIIAVINDYFLLYI